MQAGTSAPGGLVDLVVKRPLDAPLRSAFVEWRERGSVLGAVDLSQRFGADDAFGVRLNAAAERIDPIVRDASGHRNVLALAGDWRASAATLVEAEVETQPPLAAERARLQPARRHACRRRPTRASTSTTSRGRCRWCSTRRPARCASRRSSATDWRLVAHAATQRLRTDDRIAFPFGCTDAPTAPTTPTATARTAPSTSTISAARTSGAAASTLDVSLHGAADRPARARRSALGVQRTDRENRFSRLGVQLRRHRQRRRHAVTPPRPTRSSASTDRDERSTELYAARRASRFGRGCDGLARRAPHAARRAARRHRRLGATGFSQSFTTPFARAEPVARRAASSSTRAGAAASRATSRPTPAAVVRQRRPGAAGGEEPADRARLQGRRRRAEWSAAAFDIRRPLFGDIGACDAAPCSARAASSASSATAASRAAPAGAAAPGACAPARNGCTRASRTASDPTIDGKRPTNVPAPRRAAGRLRLRRRRALPAACACAPRRLRERARGAARQQRPDPGVTTFDLGARYEMQVERRHRPGRCAPASTTSSTGAPGARARTSSATPTCSRSSRARCASRCRPTSEQAAPRGPPAIIWAVPR